MKYIPTHRNKEDGSSAMATGTSDLDLFLMNEEGFEWIEDNSDKWIPVDPSDPYGYIEGVNCE